MHVDLFEALTSAHVDPEKARAVIDSLEAHMKAQVDKAAEEKLRPELQLFLNQVIQLENRIEGRIDRLIASFRWFVGSLIAIATLIVAYLKL